MNELSIFLAALDIPDPAERAAYLDKTCAGDPAVRREVEALLAAHHRSGSFMPVPTTADDLLAERPGTVVGRYKLLQQIGEGGMGAVFMAEQQEPVRRRVALKIIKPGMDSRQVIGRFEAERQSLALMDHQNIAKVYDAGTTPAGRPYFVMELIHGVPITQYCDANKLTPRQRLELFVPVCHAVQHAHTKGVIHRDIKPSNILVTMYDDRPVPKVIDFGVAKAIEQRLTEKTVFTQFGTLVGTFEYMSPEQAEMNAFGVDTRSDVYSLGVLLYELLTGSTPLERKRLREAGLGEVVWLIKEEEPPRPSVRLSTSGALAKVAAARQTDPAKLSRLMRGELDWVVMKCLEKDRTRRYETASALARDVERHLADEPVEACPPSAGYRLRKFVRRHNRPLAVAAAFALLLLAGLGLVTWKWQDERAARRDADAARRDAEDKTRQIQEGVERLNAANAAMDLGALHAELGKWSAADAEFTRATALRPDHSSVWISRGTFYSRLGLWDLVAEDYARAFALRESDNWLYWYYHALLCLETGDVSGYRRLCARGLEHFGRSTEGKVPPYLVRMLNLAPDAVPGQDGVARLAPRWRPGSRSTWFELYLVGTAHYRAGRFEQAVRTLRRSLEATDSEGGA